MKPRAAISCLAIQASGLWAGTASAAEASVGFDLVWQAPVECPQLADVSRQIVELLGAEATVRPDFHVRGSVTRVAEGGYALVLETARDTHRGSRTMNGESCAELTAAGAAVIALAIDPEFERRAAAEATSESPTAPAAEPAPAEPPPIPARRPPPATVVERGERDDAVRETRSSVGHRLELSLGAGLVADIGTLPGISAGPALSLVSRYEWLLAGVTGIWLPQKREYIADSNVGGDFDFMGITLAGCADPWGRAWTLAGCLGLGFGRVRGTGTGASVNNSTNVSWASAQAGIAFQLPLFDRLLLESGGELVIPLQRAEFLVENSGLVYRPASASARIRAGLAWRFW